MSLINQAYCIDNPENYPNYSASCWGLTASDDPFGYSVHEPITSRDNGTITPSAALSSMPYTPQESMAALKHFYRDRGPDLWGPFGFYDAFNTQLGWYADSYIAIDQGPIICMIENHRSELLWDKFMANPEIGPALQSIGFVDDPYAIGEPGSFSDISIYPNPCNSSFSLTTSAELKKISVCNVTGQIVISLEEVPVGQSVINTLGWTNGIYFITFEDKEGNAGFSKILKY